MHSPAYTIRAPLDAKSRPGYRPPIARKKQWAPASEPTPHLEDQDWAEWSDDPYASYGEFLDDTPYGLTDAEFRRINASLEYQSPWAIAKQAFFAALDRVAAPDADRQVGYVEALGKGLSRTGFAAPLVLHPDPDDLSGQYVALLANYDADPGYPARVRQEMRVLEWLSPRVQRIRVPTVLALIEDEYEDEDAPAPILIVSHVTGLAVDLRHGRTPYVPWCIVAEAASAIHATPLPPADVLPPRDRQQHRAHLVHELCDGLEDPPAVIADAIAWLREHIERPGPGVLLHGDLLGQNLRHFPDQPHGVIDWQNAEIGDPAHDLAIVTRGVRQPFKIASGAEKLLAEYHARGGVDVTATDLRFFELALRVHLSRTGPHALESHTVIANLLRDA